MWIFNMIKGIIFDWIGVLSAGSNKGIYPFSKEVIQRLKPSFKLGLVSLAGFGNQRRMQDITAAGLKRYFDSIIVDSTKTPQHYLECMDEMGVVPEQTLIVDDRTVRGIKIGNELGCQTCWVMADKYLHEEPSEQTGEPTYRIKSIKDIFKVIRT